MARDISRGDRAPGPGARGAGRTGSRPARPRGLLRLPGTGRADGRRADGPIQTPRGTFKVWTKRFGNNPRIRLLLLHGGPGATHEYFEGFESFLPAEGIEFIYYDQLGSAYSDQPSDESYRACTAVCKHR